MEHQDLVDCISLNLNASIPNIVVQSMADEFVLSEDKMQLSEFGFLVRANRTRIVEFLLKTGQDVNEQMFEGRSALHFAVEGGLTDMSALLLHHGAIVNKGDKNGFTPLHVACFCRHKDIVRLLLSKGGNIHGMSMMGTPILAATFVPNPSKIKDPFDIVQSLLAHGANVNDKRDDGETALILAVRANNSKLVKLLIDAKSDVNVFVAMKNYHKMPLISFALGKECYDIVKYLLAADTLDVEVKEINLRTPLHFASALGNLEIVKLMVEKKYDINAVAGDNPKTPLLVAIEMKHFLVAKYLLEQDTINVHLPFKTMTLNAAIAVGHCLPSIQRRLRQKVIDTIKYKAKDPNKKSPIVQPASDKPKNRSEKIKLLSENGAIVKDETTNIRPLFLAIDTGNFESVKNLLNHGVELNKDTIKRSQSVVQSCKNGAELAERMKINDFLALNIQLMKNVRMNKHQEVKENIESGACVNVFDKKSGSPLIYAAWKGYAEIVDLLLKHGADVNFKSATGSTSLHMSCRFNRDCKIVMKLLDHGAYYNMLDDKNKQTPFHYALRRKNNKSISMLLHSIDGMFEDVRMGKLEISYKAILKVMRNFRNRDGQTLIDVARAGDPANGLLERMLKLLKETENEGSWDERK